MNRIIRETFRGILLVPVLALTLLTLVIVSETISSQYQSWPRDTLGPMDTGTKSVVPINYGPMLNAALAQTETFQPGFKRVLEELGTEIEFATDERMVSAGCGSGDLGCTDIHRNHIYILSALKADRSAVAAVLAHELFHCLRHDPHANTTTSSVLTRLFFGDEESQAHRLSLRAAHHFGVSVFSDRMQFIGLDYLIWYWPLGTVCIGSLTLATGVWSLALLLSGPPVRGGPLDRRESRS